MIERFSQGKMHWVNLKNPTADEVHKVMLELGIPPTLMTDLTAPVPKNSVTRVDGTIKLVLDFPTIKHFDPSHQHEVKFFISKSNLLTVHYDEMEGIDRFKRQFEVALALRKKQANITGAHLFVSLFNNLYDTATSQLDFIETKLTDIEAEIFKNNEKRMVFEISTISKKLIAFRHVMHSHENPLIDLEALVDTVFGHHLSSEIASIRHHFEILEHRAEAQYQTLSALRETNSTMLYTKQNEILKIFTIMAFTTFPLTLFSSMFGMNTHGTPIIGHPADFWIIVGIMILATICFFAFFKHKNWL